MRLERNLRWSIFWHQRVPHGMANFGARKLFVSDLQSNAPNRFTRSQGHAVSENRIALSRFSSTLRILKAMLRTRNLRVSQNPSSRSISIGFSLEIISCGQERSFEP